jgi:hypothetical protein
VARLAKVNLLYGYDDLDLIDQYATRFGQDPNHVYDHIDFSTVVNFCVKWKLEAEYRERFEFIWAEINQTPTK